MSKNAMEKVAMAALNVLMANKLLSPYEHICAMSGRLDDLAASLEKKVAAAVEEGKVNA